MLWMKSEKYGATLDVVNRIGASLCAVLLTLFVITRVMAAAPVSGAISPNGPVAPFTGSWTGTATGTGSANGESTCQEGINCDTFTLTVQPGDYTNKIIPVKISWSVPANDYDLYVHKGSVTGPIVGASANGAPQTSEQTAIDPTLTGSGTYTVHVVYFATSPSTDQYHGTVSIQAKASGSTRNAKYIAGSMTFSPNVTLKAPVTVADGEPSNRTDILGNFYAGGIRGVPAGVDLWFVDLRSTLSGSANPNYDPYMQHYHYQGQPDSPAMQAGDGGGDIDLAVGFPTDGTQPILAFSSLVAANISVGNSMNANATGAPGTPTGPKFNLNPAGNIAGVPVDDRQWQEFYGKSSVYLLYRTIGGQVSQIQRSDDGGFTYGPATTAGMIDQTGAIAVDQKDGTVYCSFNNGAVAVGIPPTDPTTGKPSKTLPPVRYSVYQAASDPNGVAHIFFPVKVASDGTVYVVYSNEHNIFLKHSLDHGQTWSAPVQVNSPVATPNAPVTLTNVFPWLATGPKPGSVGIVWYGTTDPSNDNAADWKVYYAQTFNATATVPTIQQVTASDHYIHAGNISEGGLTGTANRNLLDYFQVSFDPNGAAAIAYTDDHNDFNGNIFVTHQVGGANISGTMLTAPPFTPFSYTPIYPQVNDFRDDVTTGLVTVVPTDDPLDILDVEYAAYPTSHPTLIQAEMTVSKLNPIPPGSAWRMNFAVNAPYTVTSSNGDYGFGLSDRGDQFYLRADTDGTGKQTFTYGTAVRNADGTITYTPRGTADGGSFTPALNEIYVQVSIAKLNALIPAGHPLIGSGTAVGGLRAETFTTSGALRSDQTRGGTRFIVP